MQLTLLQQDKISSLILPEKANGRYWVQVEEDDKKKNIISVEEIGGMWQACSGKYASLENEAGGELAHAVLEIHTFYKIRIRPGGETMLLYCEPVTDDRKKFDKYVFVRNYTVTVGRSVENTIVFDNPFVSSRHAELSCSEGVLLLTDCGSANGTFVNGRRVLSKKLQPGDAVYINGLKIIIGKDFLALNNPDGRVRCKSDMLKKFVPELPLPDSELFEDEDENESSGLFYRSPRFKREIRPAHIKIDPPPPPTPPETTPLMLLLGPSMTMGMASLFTGLFTVNNVLSSGGSLMTAMPSLVMSFSMLLGTVLWPILTKHYEKRRRKKREALRQKKYLEYLEGVHDEIRMECAHQDEILHENYSSPDDCITRVKMRQRNLWERSFGQNDFLVLRLGLGDLPPDLELKYPEKKFVLDDDSLQDALYALAEQHYVLQNVPLTLSLTENRICGIIGQRRAVVEFVRGLILQISALHSYDEVKLVFLLDERERAVWDFLKWLPHTWDDAKSIHFIAYDKSEAKDISAYLEKIFSARSEKKNEEPEPPVPHYVVFAMHREISARLEIISQLLRSDTNCGFTLLTLYDTLNNLPKECSKVIELYEDTAKIYDKDNIYGRPMQFVPDLLRSPRCNELSVRLANTRLAIAAGKFRMPEMLTFLQMFGVGKVEHLNSLARWKDNNPVRTLETEIGVTADGGVFKLDLHEKFQGPHGLVAGMTGSGKSEFIMTFILSMAVNYHPYEVAFILIDYKGGGMAKAFEKLPHTVGIITNLDGAAVNRSLVSIQSELKRRQRIFSETGKNMNISNIDIYKYQKLYRDGEVTEPLQHLFIISDEFAELKTQQPEFMQQLISAARIGRSLGVHLILATQKPSGVVDEQIWSNSRFRVCLKVQEKADSMDMLKRPDAAGLTVTGRFYLQVGYNESFETGQSAWSGAPYRPADKPERKKDRSVVVIDGIGRTVKQAEPEERTLWESTEKQLDCVTGYLSKLAEGESIRVKPLWLPPLPGVIHLDELLKKYGDKDSEPCILEPVVGEIDDPENQKQLLMTLPLSRDGNVLIYGCAGSGKSTFVTTMLYSLLSRHPADELHAYLLDFGAENLTAFRRAPQVGDVLLSGETEKAVNLFGSLAAELNSRRKLFADYGGEYLSYFRLTGKKLPSVLVVIQNYAGFCEFCEQLEEQVAFLSREGSKYGIYFVVTAINTNAVRYRTLQNFKRILVLQMNDPAEYSGVLGSTGGVIPSAFKGRGIFRTSKTYEFQTARALHTENPTAEVKAFCQQLRDQWKGEYAPKVPVLPEKVTLSFVENQIDGENLLYPVGVVRSTLRPAVYPFGNSPVNFVLSQTVDTSFAQALAGCIAFGGKNSLTVLDGCGEWDENSSVPCICGGKDLSAIISVLFDELVRRHNIRKENLEADGETPVYPEKILLLCGYADMQPKLTKDAKEELDLMLERSEKGLGYHFILFDTASNVSSYSYQPWFKKYSPLNSGIWTGNGIAEQFQLKLTKTTGDLYGDVENGFGYVVNAGRPVLVKLLACDNGEEPVVDG